MTPLFLEDRVKSGDLGRVLSISAEKAGGYLYWQGRQGAAYIGRESSGLPILAEKTAGSKTHLLVSSQTQSHEPIDHNHNINRRMYRYR